MSSRARPNPISGERTIAKLVLPIPPHTTALKPALAMPAPMSPPIRACELEAGMPIDHVMTSQAMAPTSAPKITRGVTMSPSMMPVPIVCATCRPKKMKAMKLKNDAQITAYCGLSTRVDTIVAIELPASFMPLKKSNTRAIATSATSSGSPSAAVSIGAFRPGSDVIDHDALQLVGDIVEPIDHLLEVVVDLVSGDEGHGIGGALGLEQLLEADVVQVVGPALDLGDLLGQRADAAGLLADGAQERHRLLNQHGAFDDGVAHLLHLRRERADVEQHDGLGGLLHLVDGVVHRGDEILDVAPVERRDEGAADRGEHLARHVVGVLLAVHDGAVVA